MSGRGRPHVPSLRPAMARSRRVFWAVEQEPEQPPEAPQGCSCAAGVIEITLADGIRVRVDNQVDATALRRVLDALQGR